jgi:hypothetical protein
LPDGWCPFCEHDPWATDDGASCKPKTIRGRQGIRHTWIELANEPDPPDDSVPCPCGTPVDGWHHWLCEYEICPWTDEHPDEGNRLIGCPCYEDGES